jgi:hypothetical protein
VAAQSTLRETKVRDQSSLGEPSKLWRAKDMSIGMTGKMQECWGHIRSAENCGGNDGHVGVEALNFKDDGTTTDIDD